MKAQLQEQIDILRAIQSSEEISKVVEEVITEIVNCLTSGNTLFLCGNGGSASDAMHISGELVGKFLADRPGLNAVCLNANPSIITAWGNDVSFDSIFERQLQANASSGDVLWCISTSGNSENIRLALEYAVSNQIKTILLTGQTGGICAALSDHLILVPATSTPRVQEAHIGIYHYICEIVESQMIELSKIKAESDR